MTNDKNLPQKIFFAGLIFFFLSRAAFVCAAVFDYQPPFPSGVSRISRPMLYFKVQAAGDTKISAVFLALNGVEVPAVYSSEQKAVSYQPPQPLPPGDYTVNCRIRTEGSQPFDYEWRFAIATNAVSEPPPPMERQQTLFEAVNAMRQSIGAPAFVLNPALCAAAQAHAHYVRINQTLDFHGEQTGKPGATGADPKERAAAYGFRDPVGEDGSTGNFASVTAPVTKLFEAPYHRILFLQPDGGAIGTGSEGGVGDDLVTTLEIEQCKSETTAISPFDGQTKVPTTWRDEEIPDPLRRLPFHSMIVGYPLVFAYFSPEKRRISVSAVTLATQRGGAVEVFLNSPDNDDHLSNAALVIPNKPLTPGTTYHVAVKAKTDAGVDISREWDFTTAGEAPQVLLSASLPQTQTDLRRAQIKAVFQKDRLHVLFPKTITRLRCFFDGASVPSKSSPPIQERKGAWQGHYPAPASARTYRLVVEQGTQTRVISGRLRRH